MRERMLGRWVGHLVAVAALGAGTTLGGFAAGVALDAWDSEAAVTHLATTDSGEGSETDGFEWS